MKVTHLIQHLQRIEAARPDLDVIIWKPGDHLEPDVPTITSFRERGLVCFIEVNSLRDTLSMPSETS